MSRRTFNTLERQAILLLEKLEREGRAVPRRLQKKLSAKELCSWFDGDHYPIKHTDGGTTHPSNGQMLLNAKGQRRLSWILGIAQVNEHGEKTRKVDLPQLAKDRRVAKATEEMRRMLLRKAGQGEASDAPVAVRPKRRWKSRPMDWRRFNGERVSGRQRLQDRAQQEAKE